MADKMTMAEAVSLANQNTSELSNEQLTQMQEAFNDSFLKQESRTQEEQDASDITIAEIDSRLEALSQNQNNFDDKDLDSIIAMAESVGIFSQKSDIAKAVLEKAQAQKVSLAASAQSNDTQQADEVSIGAETTANADTEEKDAADTIRKMQDITIQKGKEAETKLDELLSYAQENGFKTAVDDKADIIKHTFGNDPYMDNIQKLWNQGHPDEPIDIYEITKAIRSGQTTQKKLDDKASSLDQLMTKNLNDTANIESHIDENDGSVVYYGYDKDGKVLFQLKDYEAESEDDHGYHLSVYEYDGDIRKGYDFDDSDKISGTTKKVEQARDFINKVKAKTQNDLPKETQDSLDAAEKEPEDQEKLEQFDKENGVDKVTPEILEANGKIIEDLPHPLAKDENGNLLNPEFADELQALNNLTITDDQGKDLSEDEQNAAKQDLVFAAQLEAEIAAQTEGNGNPEDVKSLYYQQFKDSLQRNIVSAAFASDVKQGMSKEQLQDNFVNAVNNPQKATISAVQAVTANSSAKSGKLIDRLKAKFKSIPAIQKMENKVKAFDIKMTERYGKKYETAKRFAKVAWKSVKNVAIYTAVGATAGPAGLAVLAAKSGYDSYKNLQKEAKANGMSLKEYAKANKGKVALAFTTTGLSMLGSAMGLGNSMGIGGGEMAQTIQPALKTATRVLAVAPKAGSTLIHGAKSLYKRFTGDKEGAKIEWEKTKEAALRTSEAAIGIFVGSQVADAMADAKETVAENHTSTNTNNNTVLNDDNTVNWDKTMTHDWQNNEQPQPVQEQDADHDGIPDSLDIDHGEGWAKANETQLDRLMDADPAKVNALLNDGQWHSSAELKEMMENGQFNDEQLKGIHELATREFDENGHIIDADLKDFYEDLAKKAAENNIEQDTPKDEPLEDVHEDMPEMDMRTPQEQRAYNAILDIISKGEDMNDPEIRASVEGLAQSHLQEIQDALAKGDNVAVANKIAALHNQGEEQELSAATRADENDSRKMANAKEDVLEAKAKLDAAKEALAQDPNNEKLQEEVAKMEQKFDKESLDLEQREIKEARSELKDQINQDEKAYDNRDKMYQTIENATGLSEEQVNKGLASMGIDVNNLPEDTSTLPKEAQELLGVHNMYAQAHQNEADLQNRIQSNEQLRDELKNLEKESKADEKDVKKGLGLDIEAQERLAGQSQIENSELLNSVLGIQNEQAQLNEINNNREAESEYEQGMRMLEQDAQKGVDAKIEGHSDQSTGRHLSELRGTRTSTPTQEVKPTTVNTQTMVHNHSGRE